MFRKVPKCHRLKQVNQTSFEFLQLLRKSRGKDILYALISDDGNKD